MSELKCLEKNCPFCGWYVLTLVRNSREQLVAGTLQSEAAFRRQLSPSLTGGLWVSTLTSGCHPRGQQWHPSYTPYYYVINLQLLVLVIFLQKLWEKWMLLLCTVLFTLCDHLSFFMVVTLSIQIAFSPSLRCQGSNKSVARWTSLKPLCLPSHFL